MTATETPERSIKRTQQQSVYSEVSAVPNLARSHAVGERNFPLLLFPYPPHPPPLLRVTSVLADCSSVFMSQHRFHFLTI